MAEDVGQAVTIDNLPLQPQCLAFVLICGPAGLVIVVGSYLYHLATPSRRVPSLSVVLGSLSLPLLHFLRIMIPHRH